MGLFGQSSPFDAEIEKATSEKNTTELWGLIMEICDKVGSNPKNAKDCLKVIMRRMAHQDPHVVIQAITLLDACVNNCGKNFHLEVASREFENEFRKLLSKSQQPVASKMRLLLKNWAEGDFKADPQLNLIPSLYQKLKSEGHDFSDSQKQAKSAAAAAEATAALKDPNVVSSQQEEEDIAKAIELSLKEAKNSPKKQQTSSNSYPSLYPSFAGGASGGAGSGTVPAAGTNSSGNAAVYSEPRKVRALYDFEAVEDNELTFAAGDILHVLDDSDPNWWKGYNQQGEGLFPSNFVTADLSVEPERIEINQKAKKNVQFEDLEKTEEDDNLENEKFIPEINEEKIDRLLHLLHEANPEDPSQDSPEMLLLEQQVNTQGPLIDAELERVDRKHAQLTQLSSDLVDAINLYYSLMREPERPAAAGFPPISAFASGFNSPANLYMGGGVPNHLYGMPNLYQQGVGPTSLPNMIGHMMPPQQTSASGPSTSSHYQSNPQMQQSVYAASGQNNFSQQQQQPQQMIPPQFQNGGHLPPQNPQQSPLSVSQQNQQQPQPPSMLSQQQQQQPQQTNQSQTFLASQTLHTTGGFPAQQQPSFNPTSTTQHFQSPHLPHIQPTPLSHGQPPQMVNAMMGIPPQHHHQPQQFVNNQQFHNQQQPSNPHPHHVAMINQPVTQTILGQNDSKTTNIPIFQQQR